ncbi:hypothetical protein HanIR_Chr14g0717391 [Helianthus annuus]|nr:hypothetical protein HanIR_Chr14g0717391 [Helianthus annuus]
MLKVIIVIFSKEYISYMVLVHYFDSLYILNYLVSTLRVLHNPTRYVLTFIKP